MRLYLDACAIIYAIEGVRDLREKVLARIAEVEATSNGAILTSRLSRLECCVKPLKQDHKVLLSRYDAFFTRRPIRLIEIGSAVIERATELRARDGFKTPDALHMASAIEERADLFLTGDQALARCRELRVEVL